MAEEKEGSCAKPIVISDDVEMLSSPDPIDFTISEKVLHTPHKHSKHATQPTLSAAAVHATEKSRKRGRTQGNRRSDLQEEVRLALEEAQDELMDIDGDDEDVVDLTTPSPAVDYTTKMLSRSGSMASTKEVQPPATLSRMGSGRMPVQRHDGFKRSCCSTTAMSMSPAPLYGEVA